MGLTFARAVVTLQKHPSKYGTVPGRVLMLKFEDSNRCQPLLNNASEGGTSAGCTGSVRMMGKQPISKNEIPSELKVSNDIQYSMQS